MKSSCFRKASLAFVLTGVCLLAWVPAARAQAGNLAKGFPRLDHKFKVIDRSGLDYNCIAYTLGIRNQWIDPKTGPANAPFSFMDQLYGASGYRRTSALDLTNNPNLQKIAVYAKRQANGSIKEITHAALQGPDGSWNSKLGQLPLIRHANPYAVDGPMYGVPVATYVRDAGNRANAPANTKIPVQNGGGTLGRQLGGAKNTSAFAGAVHKAGANVSGRSTVNAKSASVTWSSNDKSHFGLGPFVSTAAHQGLHGTALAAYVHELQALRGHGHGHFEAAFRQAGRSVGGVAQDKFSGNAAAAGNVKGGAVNAGNTSRGPQNLSNAKNAGNSLNSLVANRGLAKNAPNTIAGPQNVGNTKNAGNSLNAPANNCGSVKNAGNAGKSQNAAVACNVKGGAVNAGNTSRGPQNLSNAKNAGNSLNSLVANRGLAKNAPNTIAGPQNVGNTKNAGNSLNAPANNCGSVKNAGNGANTRLGSNKRIGSLPGTVLVKINGNDNTVNINLNYGSAKPTSNDRPSAGNSKTCPANQLARSVAKNAGKTNEGTSHVGNTKNGGSNLNAMTNNAGRAKNCGNIGNQQVAKNTANFQKGPGALVGNKALTRNAAITNDATHQAKKTSNKLKGPGALVGNKTKNVGNTKVASPMIGNAKNSGPVSNAQMVNHTQAKNGSGIKGSSANVGSAKHVGHASNMPMVNHGIAKNVGNAKTGMQNGGNVKNAGHVANASAANRGVVKNANNFQVPKTTGSMGRLKTANAYQQFAAKTPLQTRPATYQTANRMQSAFNRGVAQANTTGRRK